MFPKQREGFVSFHVYIKISASRWPLRITLSFFRSLFFSVQAVALFVPQRQETPLLPYALYLRRLYDILNVNIFR
jgi:hypothetical protein